MSDLHLEPGGAQVWLLNNALDEGRMAITAHVAVYRLADDTFADVLDTTGALVQEMLFPSAERMLLVTARGDEAVFVALDTVARQPVRQRTYPGAPGDFALSPSGRLLVMRDSIDHALHVLDTASLVDQAIPGSAQAAQAVWATADDTLYLTVDTADAAQLQRVDLRSAMLDQPLPAATPVATIAAATPGLVLSPDDRFAAIDTSSVAMPQITVIELATGVGRVVEGEGTPAFANDDRVVVFRRIADGTHDLRLVAPLTGESTAAIPTGLIYWPTSVPLRRHDLVITRSNLAENVPSLVYDPATGAATRMSSPFVATSWFERPGQADLWMWNDGLFRLERLDLATGQVGVKQDGLLGVVALPGSDELLVSTFEPSLRRYSMATSAFVEPRHVLASPALAPAPYQLHH